MKIAVQGQAADVEVIRELLSPWNISFTGLDEAEVVIAYNEKPLETKKTLVIPSDSVDFIKSVKNMKSRIEKKPGELVFVAASSQIILTFKPKTLYYYDGLIESRHDNAPPIVTGIKEDLIFLTLNILKEYRRILDETLNAKSSIFYRLLTSLPVPYTLAPKGLKNSVMKKRRGKDHLTF